MAFPVSIKSAFCVISQYVESPEKIFQQKDGRLPAKRGRSLTGAFDLICRSAVMLWHFRHNSGLGQTNHLWYGGLAHFTFYLHLPVLTPFVTPMQARGPDRNNTLNAYSANWTLVRCYCFFFSLLLFSSFLFLLLLFSSLHACISFQWGGLEASITSSQMWDVWAKPLCHQLY